MGNLGGQVVYRGRAWAVAEKLRTLAKAGEVGQAQVAFHCHCHCH